MKSFISAFAAITFVVLATSSAFANTSLPTNAPTASAHLSDADALRLKLALLKDQTTGN